MAKNIDTLVYARFIDLATAILNDAWKLIDEAFNKKRAWTQKYPQPYPKPYRVHATGKTQQSLDVEELAHGAQLVGREDFFSVERGVAPGTRPSIEDLDEWAKARDLQMSSNQLAALQDKIANVGDNLFYQTQHGNPREPFVTPILTQAADAFIERANSDQIVSEIATDIVTYINPKN